MGINWGGNTSGDERNMSDGSIIRVGGDTNVAKCGGSVAKTLRERGFVVMQMIGANAVNQGIKAVVTARRYVEQDGLDLRMVPEMVSVDGVTVVRFHIESIKKGVEG